MSLVRLIEGLNMFLSEPRARDMSSVTREIQEANRSRVGISLVWFLKNKISKNDVLIQGVTLDFHISKNVILRVPSEGG